MANKIKGLRAKKSDIEAQMKELDALLQEATSEEISKIDAMKANINKMAEENEVFVGNVFNWADLLEMVDLCKRTGQPVKAEYKIYST